MIVPGHRRPPLLNRVSILDIHRIHRSYGRFPLSPAHCKTTGDAFTLPVGGLEHQS
jgi:hypothetical protein